VLEIVDLKVRSLDVDSKEISWSVVEGQEDVLDYTFEVLRSESPEGPFDVITPAFEDRYIFVDRRIPTGDRHRKLWYRIRTTHKATSTTAQTPSVAQQAEPDLITQAIRRMEMTLFTQVIGRAVWLFKVRTFGSRCRTCWDCTMGKRVRESCLDCFDTSFLRGYHNPIEVYVQIDPSAKTVQNNAQQITQTVVTSARMSYYPEVVPGDVLVEAENKRWRVMKVDTTERLRAVVQQVLTLHQIDQSDIEYKLPINLDGALRDIQPSPVRMFENAADLHAAIEERTPNVFAVYTTSPRDLEE
jgi:hypothetical protein